MSDNSIPFHYVCTHDQADGLIAEHDRFWVSNCGCREKRGRCQRSRTDICLMFNGDFPGSGSGKREIKKKDALDILSEAREKNLVTRPFRNEADRTVTDGICFCCDDCCGYFLDPSEKCDRGELAAETDFDVCNHCGLCADVCHFNARNMVEGVLVVEKDYCYGCGLCAGVCPEECVHMVRET